jgi:hypothetical protein
VCLADGRDAARERTDFAALGQVTQVERHRHRRGWETGESYNKATLVALISAEGISRPWSMWRTAEHNSQRPKGHAVRR